MAQRELAKSVACALKSATPDDAALAQIRQYTLADLPAEKLYVREYALAHNAIDRDGECFDEQLLNDYARTLPGKGLFVKHPLGWDGDTGPGEGRCYAARVERMSFDQARQLLRAPSLQWPPDRSEAAVLMASAYCVRTSENAALLDKIDAGIASDVSIGGSYSDRAEIKDASGNTLQARRLVGPGEAREFSLVWLGAQPGARAIKHAKPGEDKNVDELQKAQLRNSELEKQLADATKAVTAIDALRKALGEDGALIDNPAELTKAVAAGKVYRAELVAAIVKADRAAGVVGDKPEDVEAAKAMYSALPTEHLARLKDARSKAPAAPAAAPGISGGDPNAAIVPEAHKAAAGSMFDNALFSA